MTFQIRTISPEEYPAFVKANYVPFGVQVVESQVEWERPIMEFERTIAAFDGDAIVGTAANMTMRLTIPGGAILPAAGVTWVGVLPTYRRQGMLTQMMRWLLEDARRHGEPVAILNASESSIYGRFGYGPATSKASYTLDRRDATLRTRPDIAGRIRLLDAGEAQKLLPDLYERSSMTHPGAVSRSAGWWQLAVGIARGPWEPSSPRYDVAYTSAAGVVEGVAVYRIENRWADGLASSTLSVSEFQAVTLEAYTGLWAYLLDLDLVQTITMNGFPGDPPLRWMLADPRRLLITRLSDDLWLRLLDIPTTLAARRYLMAGRLTFNLTDAFLPENAGVYTLEAGPDGATCMRSSEQPDLTLDVADLGALYLGGGSVAALAQAGRIAAHSPDALRRAGELFATPECPFNGTPF